MPKKLRERSSAPAPTIDTASMIAPSPRPSRIGRFDRLRARPHASPITTLRLSSVSSDSSSPITTAVPSSTGTTRPIACVGRLSRQNTSSRAGRLGGPVVREEDLAWGRAGGGGLRARQARGQLRRRVPDEPRDQDRGEQRVE